MMPTGGRGPHASSSQVSATPWNQPNSGHSTLLDTASERQARAVAFRTHQSFVSQRTQLLNALRGHLAEIGLVVPQGPSNLRAVVGRISDDEVILPDAMRDAARLYLDQIALLTQKIEDLQPKFVACLLPRCPASSINSTSHYDLE